MRGWRVAAVAALVLVAAVGPAGVALCRAEPKLGPAELEYRAELLPGGRQLDFTVRNVSGRELILRYASGQTYEVVARRAGSVVWRWSDGRFFTEALRDEPLAPGAELRHRIDLEGMPSGSLTLEVFLVAYNVDRPPATVQTGVAPAGQAAYGLLVGGLLLVVALLTLSRARERR